MDGGGGEYPGSRMIQMLGAPLDRSEMLTLLGLAPRWGSFPFNTLPARRS